jgi:hypothetical protein
VLNTMHAKSAFARTCDAVKAKIQNIADAKQQEVNPLKLEQNPVKPTWSFSVVSNTFKFSSYLSDLREFSEYEFEIPRVAALY